MKNLPREIEIIQCTESPSNRWYEECIGISFTVMDSTRDHYIIDEYDTDTQTTIPYLVKKTDCKIIHL